ncbi:tryptophan synthase beta subunit-like PLP-dependent enzyme [Sporodiniella umbellata]|nr:tryptophan synthase beta subunit-like PLP-dependent enzyme [Sporodiniella umbellata]
MFPEVIESPVQCVGSTPMIRLSPQNKVGILAKLELNNPTGSVKDRLAKYLLEDLEKNTVFEEQKKRTLIIPTSGNLGISIASLAAKRKYRIIAILPERTSNDRVAMLKTLGVEILRAPNEVSPESAVSAYSVAARLAEQLPDAVVLDESKLRDFAPYHQLAEEILQQTKMSLDFLFVGAESGAMITGVARYLKEKIPNLKVIGVEPFGSVFSNNEEVDRNSFNWKIEDIGNNYVPSSLDKTVVDEWIKISDKDAFSTARRLIREEGILCGPSSGALVSAATRYAHSIVSDHSTHTFQSVVILNDSAKNYSSTLLSDDWMFENDMADDLMTKELEYLSQNRYRAASVEDLQLPSAVTVPPTSNAEHALDLMILLEYSQLPVITNDTRKLVGYISLSFLQENAASKKLNRDSLVQEFMFTFNRGNNRKYQVITPDTSLSDLAKFFESNSFAMVTDLNRKYCLAVATKYDLINFLQRRQSL